MGTFFVQKNRRNHHVNNFCSKNEKKSSLSCQVVVNNAPDLRTRSERERVLKMAGEMCSTRHSVGVESLQFWMNEMTRYGVSRGLDTVDYCSSPL